MIRFLLDLQTTDIIVITDNFIEKVDFYCIADFLEIERNENAHHKLSIRDLFGELLNYWKLLLRQDPDEVFLIYDLSDQYIAAFHLEKFTFEGRQYTKITKKITQELFGWAITKSVGILELKSKKWEIDDTFSMQANRNTILQGIDWSLENLRINTNPVHL